MRFSILSLKLESSAVGNWSNPLEPTIEYIREENVSVVGLCGLAPGDFAGRLGAYGLKYESVAVTADRDHAETGAGPGIVSQLPVIASANECVSDNCRAGSPDVRYALAARVGVSPGVNVDVVAGGAAGPDSSGSAVLDRVLDFVETSNSTLAGDVAPRRRGRPPKTAAVPKWSNAVRLVMLTIACSPGYESTLASKGFSVSGSEDGEVFVCVRPGLRPTHVDPAPPVLRSPGVLSALRIVFEV